MQQGFKDDFWSCLSADDLKDFSGMVQRFIAQNNGCSDGVENAFFFL